MATLDFTPLFRSTIGFDQLPACSPTPLSARKQAIRPTTSRRSVRTSTASSWRWRASARTTSRSFRSRTGFRCEAS